MNLSSAEIAISSVTLLYFIAAMFGVFVLLPWLLLKQERDLALDERFWCAFLYGSGYWIALVLILAPLRFHDGPGLIASSLLLVSGFLIVTKRLDVRETWDIWFHDSIRKLLDLIERSTSFRLKWRDVDIRRWLNPDYLRRACSGWDYPRLLVWAVFLYAAYLRLHDSITHYSFSFSDPYVHIVWLKDLNHGDVFADGVYPRGYHAFLSVLGTFSGLEPAVLIRFAGGVMGSLTCPALYFLLRQCRIPWSGALVGTSLLAVCSPFEWVIGRQTASLSQECGVVFALAALGFAVRYLRFGNTRDRWAFAAGSFAAWSIHTFAGELLVVAGLCIAVDYLWRSQKALRRLPLLVREAVLSAVAGNLFLLVGRLLGYPFYNASLDYVERGISSSLANSLVSPSAFETLLRFITREPAQLILPLVVVAVPMAMFGMIRRKEPFPSPLFMSLWMLVLFGLMVLKILIKVTTPLPPDRARMFITLPVCGIAAYLYSLALEPLLGKWLEKVPIRAGCASLTLGILLCFFYQPPPAPEHRQYEEEARLYYRLASELPPGWWTIVGQNEDYELALDRGFTINVAKFIHSYPPYLKRAYFPTPYMFIVVEKHQIPLPINYQEEAVVRAKDESALQDWVQVYSASHSDLRLYEETKNVAVYVLYHPEVLRQRLEAGKITD